MVGKVRGRQSRRRALVPRGRTSAGGPPVRPALLSIELESMSSGAASIGDHRCPDGGIRRDKSPCEPLPGAVWRAALRERDRAAAQPVVSGGSARWGSSPLDQALAGDHPTDIPQTRCGDDAPPAVAVRERRPFLGVAGVSAVRASPHEGDPIPGWPLV
jgi:hypothetical protein